MSLYEAGMLAQFAHRGQTTKSGEDYYTGHLVPVMHIVRQRGGGPTEQMIALLHDSIEDTFVTREYLDHFFGSTIATAVNTVSRIEFETYAAFIDRIIAAAAINEVGRMALNVKTADIIHHLQDTAHISESMIERYTKAAIKIGFIR